MKKQDGRHLAPDSRKKIRTEAIALWQQGHTRVHIAGLLGVHHVTIGHWIKIYRQKGLDGLQLKKRGRPYGACRTLTSRQEAFVLQTILEKTPDQLKLPALLWTRRLIQTFINERYHVKIPIRSIGEYSRRWGINPAKPPLKNSQPRPEPVQVWFDEKYPAILDRARNENAEIYWCGTITLSPERTLIWPSLATVAGSHGRDIRPAQVKQVLYAVSNQGTVRFFGFAGDLMPEVFLDFTRRLQQSSSRKLFLIIDIERIFQARLVKAWKEKYHQEVDFFLSAKNSSPGPTASHYSRELR